MPNVLIAPFPIRRKPGPFREALEAAGFTPIDLDGGNALTEEQMAPVLPETEAMLAGAEKITAAVMDRAPRLRVIARTGVGYDTVDIAAATARKIAVTITPGTNHDAVAEQAFALLLGVTRRVPINDQTIRAGGWDRTLVQPLRGRTLGLVGLGRIGRAMAIRALAFGMNVVAYDTLADADFDARHGIRRLSLDQLLAEAHVVSLHVPLLEATKGMINRESLARMRPGSFLLNTARGGLVVEADLAEALASGHLAGAGLDVLNEEPSKADNPLFQLPNIVFSPHIAGVDIRSMADMALKASECIVALHKGEWPAECIVNPEIAEGWTW